MMNVKGKVVKGRGLGTGIGVPTINVECDESLLINKIEHGVYASLVQLENGERWVGALHYGPRKTFEESHSVMEIHLLDFEGDLYNQTVVVEFREKIRGVVKFENVDALVAQIKDDIARVRELSST